VFDADSEFNGSEFNPDESQLAVGQAGRESLIKAFTGNRAWDFVENFAVRLGVGDKSGGEGAGRTSLD